MQQQIRSRFDLPLGCRFRPNDCQLLCCYHYNKVKGLPLSSGFVEECDLYGSQEPREAWEMYGGGILEEDEDLYFFAQLKRGKSGKGKRICRKIGSGTWDGGDGAKEIKDRSDKVTGWRKRLRYEKKGSELHRNGGWIMHEYTMVGDCEEVVLCRIRKNQVAAGTQTTVGGQKKRKITKATEEQVPVPVAVAVAHHDDHQGIPFADEDHYQLPSSTATISNDYPFPSSTLTFSDDYPFSPSTIAFSNDDDLSSIFLSYFHE